MINSKTLETVVETQNHLQTARRCMEDLKDKELENSEWKPGHGEKPHRIKELEKQIYIADNMISILDMLWS